MQGGYDPWMSGPLRIGFVVSGFSIPSWQVELMDAVASEPGLERSLLLVNRGARISNPIHPILVAYDAFDRFLRLAR